MTDDMEKKRAWVAAHWNSARWRSKVRKMSDAQVIAIYMREHNKAREKPKKDPPKEDMPF